SSGVTAPHHESPGDVVVVELPEVGDTVAVDEACAVVESVKAASDIFAPISGEIVEINEELDGAPELINEDPYGGGWLLKMTIGDEADLEALLNDEAYQAFIDEEG